VLPFYPLNSFNPCSFLTPSQVHNLALLLRRPQVQIACPVRFLLPSPKSPCLPQEVQRPLGTPPKSPQLAAAAARASCLSRVSLDQRLLYFHFSAPSSDSPRTLNPNSPLSYLVMFPCPANFPCAPLRIKKIFTLTIGVPPFVTKKALPPYTPASPNRS